MAVNAVDSHTPAAENLLAMENFDIDRVRAFLAERERRRRRALEKRLEAAERDAAAIIERLKHEIDPARIYQWGSLVHQEHFSEISDIDIAVEGLSGPAQYFQALGIAMEETDFRVDVVELDKLDSESRNEITRRGRLVYER